MSASLPGVTNDIAPQVIENPILVFLKEYWDAKRGARIMPSRSDIRPADMKEHLGWIVLLDALPDFSDFRYRTIGTRVAEYFLSDSTGKTLSEAFDPYGSDAVKAIIWTHRRAAKGKVPVRSHGSAGWLGRSFLDFDSLFLPLSDDGATANMILGAFTFDAARLMQAPANPPSRSD